MEINKVNSLILVLLLIKLVNDTIHFDRQTFRRDFGILSQKQNRRVFLTTILIIIFNKIFSGIIFKFRLTRMMS